MNFISFIILQATDYASRGRVSDYSDNHTSPIEYVFLGFGIIVVIVIASIWIYSVIKKHKESILNAIGTIFIGILGLGAALLIAKCGETLKNNNYEFKSNEPEIEASVQNNTTSNNNEVERDTYDPWSGYPPVISESNNEHMNENDFLVAVINNPSFTIYDFLNISGLNTSNTQFLSFERYCRSNFIRQRYDPTSFRDAYNRTQRAWNILCRLQNIDLDDPEIRKYMMKYSPFDTNAPRIEQASNPILIRDLRIIPLQN